MALELSGDTPWAMGLVGHAYARADRKDKTQKLLKKLHDHAQQEYVMPSSFASIYMGLGEIDQAFDWLEKAVEELDGPLLDTHVSAPLKGCVS